MPRLLPFLLVALLAGCASGGAVSAGQNRSLTPGQQVALSDDSTLRYVGIANDSRCPPDVQCIRAGDADVLFAHSVQGTSHRITLNTEHTRAATFGAWQLLLIELAPGAAPRVTVRIEVAGAAP